MGSEVPVKVCHGGLIKRYEEKTGKKLIDFSASLNPFVPEFQIDYCPELLDHYPDDDYSLLKDTIGTLFKRDPEEIAVGNGSVELIRAFCQAVISRGTAAEIRSPTFGEYRLSVELAGGHVAGGGETPAASFLCNPNNPTGFLYSREEICNILSLKSAEKTCLFVDEAFIELSDPGASVAGVRDPFLFVLRSLTKCFSVPGLRFGYAFGDPDLVSRIETYRSPWSVNAFAEHFALKAFSHFEELSESREKIRKERERLTGIYRNSGLEVTHSSANFLLIDVGMDAGVLQQRLVGHHVLVRDCSSFGLPRSIRISVRTPEENDLLVGAVEACLHL